MSTTRRLYLLRHAQAFPGGPSDHERQLDERGEADARALGALLVARSILPGRVVSSDAARTRGTWECLAAAGLYASVAFASELYNGTEDAYRAVASAGNGTDLMIIGHNPVIAQFARALASRGEPSALAALQEGFPTCGLAILRFEGAADLADGFLEAVLAPLHPLR